MTKDGNHAGPFVSLKVTDAGRKNFSIFVLKGGRNSRGWLEMAELLRELGVQTHLEMQKRRDTEIEEKMKKPRQKPCPGTRAPLTGKSFVDILQQSPTREDEAEVDFKEKDSAKTLDQMDWCLVGDWIGTNSTSLNLEKARKEMKQAWRLNRYVGLANLGEKKFLLEFDSKGEAMRVLQKGERKFSSFRINLRRWKPDEGCVLNPKTPKKSMGETIWPPCFLMGGK